MAAGRVIVQPRAARTPAVAAQDIGRHAALVEKHVLRGIVQRQRVSPVPPLGGDVRPPLFVRVYGCF